MALTLLKARTHYSDTYMGPTWVEPAGVISYADAVLRTYSRTERIMSDVWESVTYAEVWTGSEVKSVSVAVSSFPADYKVEIDATPEVLELANSFLLAKATSEAKAKLAAAIEKAKAEAARVTTYKTVKVVKGRKVPKGTEGDVFWVGPDKFSRYGGLRIGMKDAAGVTHWTAASNVEVVNPESYFDASAYPARDFEAEAKRTLSEATAKGYEGGWYRAPVALAA